MTTYSTQNPIGSSDPRDLYDNAENLDNLVNGDQPAYNDRTGVSRKSWTGVEQQVAQQATEFAADQASRETTFANFLNSSGFEYLGAYGAGVTFTEYNQYVVDAGEAWFIDPTTPLPYTTTGAGLPEGGALMSRGEALLRQELGSGIRRVDSLAGLQAISGRFSGDVAYMVGRTSAGDGGEGEFRWDSSDLSASVSADTMQGVYVAPTSAPTGAGGSWVRMFDSSVSVKWFGAAADGVADDTQPFQAALRFSYLSAKQSGFRNDGYQVHLPAGDYRIAQANTLFQGLPAASVTIFGDGKEGTTTITYDNPSATAGDYLFYNDNRFGFTKFKDIRFRTANVGNEQNFMYYSSAGTAQSLTFVSCRFENFYRLFDVQGVANASENLFIQCSFHGFSGPAFSFNNPQAVNWRFFSCEAESFSGTLFEWLAGANFVWVGGSIIPDAASARVLKVPTNADDNKFGSGNLPNAHFINVRFEMRSGALMAEKAKELAIFQILFDACGMGGGNIPDPSLYDMFLWQGGGRIFINACQNMEGYHINHTVSNNASPSRGSLSVAIKSSDWVLPNLIGSTFNINGPNVYLQPIFSVEGCGSGTNGNYRVSDSSYGGSIGVSAQKHAVSFNSEANTIGLQNKNTSRDFYIPPKRIVGVHLYPVSTSSYGATAATIEIVNAAETVTLASFSWTMNAPEQVKFSSDCNYFVDTLNGDYLKVKFNHSWSSDIAVFFKGNLFLEY